ncbi:class I SAM-dependent methyltransferase [Halogeometricum limi]|uniref:Methyltransferase domain-containing protein n=1 Tax=Halogeometricum limi TaxID=555875 RepID=A0A1I6G2R3_9EURY|nr:methyltransferase domain-containing protein [Halogeometricum limi]SFR36476.1 Methyltransferase domain-containing protein [Halogeometricum limi]
MEEPLSEFDRRKFDSRPDETFYDSPRFVTHADEGFLDRLRTLYESELSPGDRVFDAMSSWVSHLPDTAFDGVVGHGLNADELDRNDRLDEWFVQDLNVNQSLPLSDGSFDAVLCALSVQYLQYPAAVFREFARVLADDGVLVVSFTNRMFPTKAVRAWRAASMDERAELVTEYVASTGAFESVRVVRDRPQTDPFYAVVARAR